MQLTLCVAPSVDPISSSEFDVPPEIGREIALLRTVFAGGRTVCFHSTALITIENGQDPGACLSIGPICDLRVFAIADVGVWVSRHDHTSLETQSDDRHWSTSGGKTSPRLTRTSRNP